MPTRDRHGAGSAHLLRTDGRDAGSGVRPAPRARAVRPGAGVAGCAHRTPRAFIDADRRTGERPMATARELLKAYVRSGKLMQVATLGADGAPAVCNVWYDAHFAPDLLRFISRRARRQSANIWRDSRVAGSVVAIPLDWSGPTGTWRDLHGDVSSRGRVASLRSTGSTSRSHSSLIGGRHRQMRCGAIQRRPRGPVGYRRLPSRSGSSSTS
jgi:hypothetical protein